jgi:citrate lyase subunit beta/citryl-CoA lyase
VSSGVHRSWLFVPGDNERALAKAFDAGADEVIIDLEDSVPSSRKALARGLARRTLERNRGWVRINSARSYDAHEDLAEIGHLAAGLRIPKVEGSEDVEWVRQQAPNRPLTATIETALGLHRAFEIAASPAVLNLAFGSVDLALDLRVDPAHDDALLYARSQLVAASRAAGLSGPCDGAFVGLDDDDGLRRSAVLARRLGFSGKSAIHPRQIPVIHAAFAPTPDEIEWASKVVEAFDASNGGATRTGDGFFVDRAVFERARQLLEAAGVPAHVSRGPE